MLSPRKNALIIGLALVAGIAFVVVMANLRPGPEESDSVAESRSVRVMPITPMPFRMEARGYGNVRAARRWQAVARVGGRITERHPNLESGNLINEGTELLRIDPTRYELAVASAEADLASARSDKRQLEQKAANTRLLLELEKERLALAERELERVRNLAERDAVSRTRLDEQERATLQQRQAVQSLENELALIPSQRDNLEARIARAESALGQARQDLEDTHFSAPFDLRIHKADVEQDEEVRPGQTLFTADGIATAEAVIQLPVAQLRRLMRQLPDMPAAELKEPIADLHRRIDLSRIDAQLSLAGDPDTTWDASVTRVASGLDPGTRTVQVVLSVEEPYRNANPPEQPPLVRDMYVRGTLSLPTPDDVIVVPAATIHGDRVYLADDGDRLERRRVSVAWSQDDLSVIREGLSPGERLVLDDLVPAIEGTRLSPGRDEEALETIRNQARSAAP
ncbi:RND family efflux transporter MFP subunit [Halospina denitrificans]|uniref:RND family efflux transporter MFP subunit n=1 Tax=Halospina denitrificans TaxID=332522 RepID=A0A4R7JQ18_9GAMM|nr:efflux transporter periplasmic adaptor subunit [Halospina denitrificans]TDT40261.1 RND family efflux transporter MFP subunit [Halospina denitrificans]